jgi:hypothetical protein|tara:strand:- start:3259 stop:3795 length:537 start_codon:yes stop_codon:yes gene_type:complete
MYALDRKTAKLRNFESKKVANQNGNGFVLFENAEQLLENLNVTGESSSLFVDAYNNHSDKPVKKFENRQVAAKRITQLAATLEVERDRFNQSGEDAVEVSAVQEPAPKEKRASFKGKMIRSKTPTNPRREATKGFHSMQILIDAGVSISYEDYVAGGGRPNDLAWDISKGNAEVTGSW